MVEEADILTQYLRWRFNNTSIEILEEILGNKWDETIIHYYDNTETMRYTIIKYSDLDIFERRKKINKICQRTQY